MELLNYILFFIAGGLIMLYWQKKKTKKAYIIFQKQLSEIFQQETNAKIKELEKNKLTEPLRDILVQTDRNFKEFKKNTKPLLSQHEVPDPTDQLKKSIENLYLVNELGRKVTSSLNLQQTFNHLYTTINSMMDAAIVELSVYNEQQKTWKIISNTGYATNENTIPYHNHIAEWCYKNNREVFLADAEQDYGRYVFKPLIFPDGKVAASIIAFPIINNNKVSGTLCVISLQKNMFSDYHREIILLLLGYISVAMENALTHEELNITKIRAEQSEKFKEKFLANMSHEIRTPINAVTGMTRLLLEKSPRNDQLRYLESIRNASDSLLVIINDILDLSKIEAGKVELEKIDFTLADVIRNVKEIIQLKAEEKGLSLHESLSPSVNTVLIGDPSRLSQILVNLVGNAVKFTENGNVTIGVIAEVPSDADDGISINEEMVVQFSITDTGIGMNQEQQHRLFKDYSQASAEINRKYGGTGLGLSISRQLVQIMGGNIVVNSTPGVGSTFSFLLKFPISKNKTLVSREKSISAEMIRQLKGIKVLIADDNEYNRIIARETLQLKLNDISVDEATDGEMALELIKKHKYDVILMDLIMPKIDGLEATRAVRRDKNPSIQNIRIIALTASVIKSEIDKCYAAGMNGFIPKPFKPYELIGAIYAALFGEQPLTFESPEKITKSNSGKNGTIDLDYLQEITEGDRERMQRHIDLFISKTPSNLEQLHAAMKKKDYETLRIVSHSMKPQLRSVGLLKGFEIADSIELKCREKDPSGELSQLLHQLTGICEKAIEELKTMPEL